MRRARAFTLIEVVVATAIFGVIMSIVFPTLMQFLDLRERLEQKHRELGSLQKAFLFIGNDIRFAAARIGKDDYGELQKTTLSVADDYLLELTGLYPVANLGGLSVPRRVRWILEDQELKRQQFPVLDPGSDSRKFTQVLLRGVDNVQIELRHIEDGRDTSDDRWEEQRSLPDMLEITVQLQDGREYLRKFSMLSGEAQQALSAIDNAGANAGGASGGGSAPGLSPGEPRSPDPDNSGENR
ncbi:MAG: type II secretion system minor pseudopilin GspJ [Gammaproteobacteria bacterium]|nr:type II secretion system minor pseudopilin GspJ [Gammaproteobacteria bacterium]